MDLYKQIDDSKTINKPNVKIIIDDLTDAMLDNFFEMFAFNVNEVDRQLFSYYSEKFIDEFINKTTLQLQQQFDSRLAEKFDELVSSSSEDSANSDSYHSTQYTSALGDDETEYSTSIDFEHSQ